MSVGYWESTPSNHVVNLSGALNASRAEGVIQLFREMAEQGVRRVVVNLEDVPFIDSRGLAALLAGYKIFGSERRNFRLTGVQDQPRLVFDLTGFDEVFEIVPSIPGLSVFLPQLAVHNLVT
jgi:anti-anti-sigma factor